MSRWLGILLLMAGLALTSHARGEIEGGIGMEYFSVQAFTRDAAGKYFGTLIQSTLAKAAVKYSYAGWFGQFSGGRSDWASSGMWQGTDFDSNWVDERFLWAWQQQVGIDIGYEYDRWQLGVSYWDHDVKNYYGDQPRLLYRLREYEAFLKFAAFRNSSTSIILGAGYAPQASLELFESGYLTYQWITDIYEVDSSGTAPRWHGNIHLKYRDSEHWSIDVIYDAGWAQFSNPSSLSEISLRTGSLTGYFNVWF